MKKKLRVTLGTLLAFSCASVFATSESGGQFYISPDIANACGSNTPSGSSSTSLYDTIPENPNGPDYGNGTDNSTYCGYMTVNYNQYNYKAGYQGFACPFNVYKIVLDFGNCSKVNKANAHLVLTDPSVVGVPAQSSGVNYNVGCKGTISYDSTAGKFSYTPVGDQCTLSQGPSSHG